MSMTYNKIHERDFEYMEQLGEGGFGRVNHVKKSTTGKHYAMKIQLKTMMIEMFVDNPDRLLAERNVLAKCRHPYILELDYAFQTPSHAVLVTGLVSGGDLQVTCA